MDEKTDNNKPVKLKLELKKTFDAGKIKQSFSHGRSRSVTVEVKKKRFLSNKFELDSQKKDSLDVLEEGTNKPNDDENLESLVKEKLEPKKENQPINQNTNEISNKNQTFIENNNEKKTSSNEKFNKNKNETIDQKKKTGKIFLDKPDTEKKEIGKKLSNFKLIKVPKSQNERRKGKLTISEALNDNNEKVRSLAAVKRAREKAKLRLSQQTEIKDQSKEKKKKEVVIPDFITVSELGSRLAEKTSDIIKILMKLGIMATINQTIDADTAELIVIEFGHVSKRVSESDVEIGLSGENDKEGELSSRPPVVTIMGHVDHGKTSLLDAIREKKVTQSESGGITQHIGAYMVKSKKGLITFLDTPGHAAFSQMRSRGSSVTDLVVLVVAADDSVKQQTEEAINHAKAAKCPIIVAVNKIDLPNANVKKVEADLMNYGVISEKMGGETLLVEVSAKNKLGLEQLIETIYLQSELLELKANPNRKAEGTVIESKVETGRGPVISVIVKKGKLKVGDIIIAGKEWGKVRALSDDEGNRLDEAFPSFPVEILGLSGAPDAGDEFVVVENESRAREVTQYRDRLKRARDNNSLKRGSVEQMISDASAESLSEFNVIIKADVHGSKEALEQSFLKLENDKVRVKILHTGVGEINESDVSLATATNALIIGFNIRTNVQARNLAKRDGIQIKYFSIIYEAIDEVQKQMSNLLEPEFKEQIIGLLEVKKIFRLSKSNNIAGCEVLEGYVKSNSKIRILRDSKVIRTSEISSLKREKNETKEVKQGLECGVKLSDYNDFIEGDKLECFLIENNK